jgi:hypothetical protein
MDKQTSAQISAIDECISTLKKERESVLRQYYDQEPVSLAITSEFIERIRQKARLQHLDVDTLLIGMPKTSHINICGKKMFIEESLVVGTVCGIKVVLDPTLKGNDGYLFDSKSYSILDNKEEKSDDNKQI